MATELNRQAAGPNLALESNNDEIKVSKTNLGAEALRG